MKKKLSLVLAILLLVTLSFAGCGSKDSAYIGTWKAVKIVSASGQEIKGEMLTGEGGDMILEIQEGQKCVFTFGDDSETGKWEETEDGIIVDGSLEFVLEDDMLVADLGGDKVYMERQ